MKKFFRTLIVSAVLSIACSVTALAGAWQQDAKGWWYQNDDGSYTKNGWQWIDGNGDGTSECYYFNEDGYCVMEGTTPDGCRVNEKGAWVVDNKVQTQTVKQPEQPTKQAVKQQETKEQTTDKKETMVWLSRTGTKYHSNPNCSNMKNPTQATLQQAQAQGRTPCKKCY